MKRFVFAAVLLLATTPRPDPLANDFHSVWEQIASTYAYFDRKETRWDAIPKLYAADVARLKTKRDLVTLLEQLVDELYDPHAQLTVNTATSWRLVPSGTDLWAEWRGDVATIVEVRAGSDAQRAGIRAGDVVVALNGVGISDAVDRRMGRSYPHTVAAARDWALRSVLAGRHNRVRTFRLRDGRTIELPARDQYGVAAAPAPLASAELRPGIGYIRFHDSLGDRATIAAFDDALASLRNTRALIVDLRDAASGGNTTVARGILGRFVDRDTPYQKHELPSEERDSGVRRSWLELVSPRGPFRYGGRVIVLVDHWTGSMGEGLAIGFDAAAHATIVGTPMAGLLGATYRITLPDSGISINVPAERLYHVDGTPREAFTPKIAVDVNAPGDAFIDAALRATEFLGAPRPSSEKPPPRNRGSEEPRNAPARVESTAACDGR